MCIRDRFENDSAPRRTAGPAIAAIVSGAILGGLVAFGAGAAADNTSLPSAEAVAVDQDSAFLGAVQYGGRVES